ncbi:MAG: SHOCT domain-containing protein [Burkholderiales bacterium]|nr:SHOCT domain-containing protein [Burkholderiales bacterium]MDE2565033.1 SHOCT domain-containing protein [Burkholderiales bacterium]
MLYNGPGMMGGLCGLGWLSWALIVGLLLVLALRGWRRGNGPRQPTRETPAQQLQRRLAGGEISPEDYERRKALLDRDGRR